MKEGVLVGKIDDGPNGYDQQVGLESFVVLRESGASRLDRRNVSRQRRQPNDDVGVADVIVLGGALNRDFGMKRRLADAETCAGKQGEQTGTDSAQGPLQNDTPIDRLIWSAEFFAPVNPYVLR